MMERLIGPEQTQEIYHYLSKEQNWFWWVEGAKPTYEQFEDWLRGCASDPIGLFIHRVRRADSYVFLGFSRMSRTSLLHGISYLTVWVAPCWRQQSGLISYGSVATAEILEFAFQNYPLRKVYHHIVVDNKESIRPASKIFQLEGCLKEHYFFQGIYRDVAVMSVTRVMWSAIFSRYRKRIESSF